MAGERLSKGVTFWGMVGATMTALKLKDTLDNYRQVSSEEDGHGPLALHSPSDAPPSYRDEDDLESAPLHGGLTVDTEMPGARPKRKDRRGSCGCCGAKCGYFWKAFGLVSMIFIVWQVIRLILWMLQPTPTGLEEMPVYSESLGCFDAPYLFQGENVTYTVPVDQILGKHQFDVQGQAVGTLYITSGAPGDTDIKLDFSLRTGDMNLLDQVSVHYPTAGEVSDGASESRLRLSTARDLAGTCMRYDAIMYVPTNLKSLRIESRSVTHIKFDPEAKLDLDVVSIVLHSADTNNLLLPTTNIQAGHMSLEITRGWMVGDVSIVDKTSLITQRGDASSNVKIHPAPSLEETPAVAMLQTTTGAGRSDFTWVGNRGAPHRPISSTHGSSRHGDLYLTYKDAEFNGRVDLESKAYSATGVQGLGLNRNGDELPWVGNKDGGDKVKIQSLGGWVGLYF